MKYAIALIVFVLGTVLGILYGWRSGYTDGQVAGAHGNMSFIKGYGALRGGYDTKARDRLVDFRMFDIAHTLANGHGYSPLFQIMHPKADEGLLNIEAYWELNFAQPSVWREGFYPKLFDVGSKEEKASTILKAENADRYQQILKEHQKLRNKKPAGLTP